MAFPAALKGEPRIIVFTDFDGTITEQDSNDFLTGRYGMGEKPLRELNLECLEGRVSFRTVFQKMVDSNKAPFPTCLGAVSENITLDRGFKAFFDWAQAHNVPIVILSSGMEQVIRTLLLKLIGTAADDVDVVANKMVELPGHTQDEVDGWTVEFHDDSVHGHDKSLTIRPYAQHFEQHPEAHRPTLLYCGDGTSDLSAAREADLLFAKEGRDLVTYCQREGVPFTTFKDWSSILQTTKDIYEGKITVQQAAAEGREKAATKS